MTRRIFFIAACFFLLCSVGNAQNVNGKVKSTGNAQLHVIRLYTDSFPKVALVFQAETDSGKSVWNLQKQDVRVEENDRQGKITDFRLLSAEQHLQTMLIIDHSGSMEEDWRYWEWYNKIDWDTIPNADTIRSYYKETNPIPSNYNSKNSDGITYTGPLERRDTFYVTKQIPVNPDYHTPLWYAQQGAKVFLKSLSSKDSTGLIGFSDYTDVDIPLAGDNESTNSQIDNMNPDGATAFFDAVDQSLSHLVYHRGLRAIVALTDGGDNSSKISLRKLIAKAKKMHCPVYVIGLGDVDEVALQKLTSETGGELFLTNDATKLQDVFLRISRKLQSVYELTYESPFLKSTEPTHELQLRFDVDSMFLNSQLIDLPLPESVITHLQKREAQQNDFQQNYPLNKEDTAATIQAAEPSPVSALSQTDPDEPSSFPYGPVGITLLVAGAGTLIYRKTQNKQKQKQTNVNLLEVFPNPTTGPVTINYFADAQVTDLRLRVLNDQGTEVYQQMILSSVQTAGINLESYASGIYFIRLESSSGVSETKQIILQK